MASGKFVQGDLFGGSAEKNKNKGGTSKGSSIKKDKVSGSIIDVELPASFTVDRKGEPSTVGQVFLEDATKQAQSPEEVEAAVLKASELNEKINSSAPTGSGLVSAMGGYDMSNAPILPGDATPSPVPATPSAPAMKARSGLATAIFRQPSSEEVTYDLDEQPRAIAGAINQYQVPAPTVTNYGLSQEDRNAWNQYVASNPRAAMAPRTPLAIEKLSVQDYFPDNHNIAVGSYSRKTLGSGNIYAAGGALFPMGLVDARKRKIEEKALKKQAEWEKLREFSYDTADQYQQYLDERTNEKMMEYYDQLNGQDPSVLMDLRNPLGQSFYKFRKDTENLYKEVTTLDALARKVLKDQDDGKYVPEETLAIIKEWINGREGFIDDHTNGLKRVSELSSRLQSFENISTFANDAVARLQKSGPEEMPLNLKEGIDPAKHATQIAQALIFKSGMSYDQYISGVSKYYDTEKIAAYVEEAWKQNNFFKGFEDMTPEQRAKIESEGKASMASMIINQLTGQVELKQELKDNENLERRQQDLAERKFQWEKDQSRTTYQEVSQYGQWLYENTQRILAMPGLNKAQKDAAIAQLMKNSGNYNIEDSRIFGTPSFRIDLTPEEKSQPMVGNAADLMTRVRDKKGNYRIVSVRKFHDLAKTGELDENHSSYKNAAKMYSYFQTNGPGGKQIQFSPSTRSGFIGARDDNGRFKPITSADPGAKPFTVLNTYVTKTIKKPIMQDGKQVVKDGELQWEYENFEGTFWFQSNGDDVVVQSGFDKPKRTGQINKNPNQGY